jgi:hypothetical protein
MLSAAGRRQGKCRINFTPGDYLRFAFQASNAFLFSASGG